MEYKWDVGPHTINREFSIVNVIQELNYWIITVIEAKWNTICKIETKLLALLHELVLISFIYRPYVSLGNKISRSKCVDKCKIL